MKICLSSFKILAFHLPDISGLEMPKGREKGILAIPIQQI